MLRRIISVVLQAPLLQKSVRALWLPVLLRHCMRLAETYRVEMRWLPGFTGPSSKNTLILTFPRIILMVMIKIIPATTKLAMTMTTIEECKEAKALNPLNPKP